MVGNQ